MTSQDEFTLYDLRVEVVEGDAPMVCDHRPGDYFELSGENLSLPAGQTFPIYPLAALIPLLPAKQRETHPHDWMTTDMEVACPDPLCGARFRIKISDGHEVHVGMVLQVKCCAEATKAIAGNAETDAPIRYGRPRFLTAFSAIVITKALDDFSAHFLAPLGR